MKRLLQIFAFAAVSLALLAPVAVGAADPTTEERGLLPADLSLSYTADQTSPVFGDTVVLTLTVSNDGPGLSSALVVSAPLPSGLAYVADDSATSATSYDPVSGRWDVGVLGTRGAATSLRVSAEVRGGGSYTAVAEIASSEQIDPDSIAGNGVGRGEDDEAGVFLTPRGETKLADLSIAKAVDNRTPSIGSQVVFTLILRNAGPDDATGVTIADKLPSGVVYVSDDAAEQGTAYNLTTGVWDVGQLSAGASRALDVTVTVTAGNNHTNTAQVLTSDQRDPDSRPGNGTTNNEDDEASVSVVPTGTADLADLSLTKTVDDITPPVTSEIAFTLTVRNDGPGVAGRITVVDLLPSGLAYVSDNAAATGMSYDAQTGVWRIGTLAAGTLVSMRIIARVLETGDYLNSAEIATVDRGDPDSRAGNGIGRGEDDEAAVAVAPTGAGESADLSLEKEVDDPTPALGGEVVFTLRVANAGPDDAGAVLVLDRLPGGLEYVGDDAASSNTTYNPITGVWNVGEVAAGSSIALAVRASVRSAEATTNVAEVAASDQLDPDSTPGNGTGNGEDDEAVATVTPLDVGADQADLSLTKTVDQEAPLVGGQVVFTVEVSNDGPASAGGVTVVDRLPDGLLYVADDAGTTGTTYDSVAGLWSIGGLAVGQTLALRITATVTAQTDAAATDGVPAPLTNTAEIASADQPDPDSVPGNGAGAGEDDDASVTLFPVRRGLSVVKSVDRTQVAIGDFVRYTIRVENLGSQTAEDVELRDDIPGGFAYVEDSAQLRGGSGTLIVTGNDPLRFGGFSLEPGETATITYLLRVGAGVTEGNYVNRVTPLQGGVPVGNDAVARVTLVSDPDLEQTTIIGKVFHDRDGDGWQDVADATGVELVAVFKPGAYQRGSVAVRAARDSGVATIVAPVVVESGEGSEVAVSLGLIAGRRSQAEDAQHNAIIVSFDIAREDNVRLMLRSTEGTRVLVDDAGNLSTDHTGSVARGMNGQDLRLEPRVNRGGPGLRLSVAVENHGIAETGVPGVRIADVGGLLAETDAHGRYHLAGIEGGRFERGRNFILKVDPATLPAGAEFTTENPRVRRITQGLMNRIDFGVRLPEQTLLGKSVEIRLGEVFFVTNKPIVRPQYAEMLDDIADRIRRHEGGVVSIRGHADARASRSYNFKLALARAEAVYEALRERIGEEGMANVEVRVDRDPAIRGERGEVEPVAQGERGFLQRFLPMVFGPDSASDDAGGVRPGALPQTDREIDTLTSQSEYAVRYEPTVLSSTRCTAELCTTDEGRVIEVISHGEDRPRSTNKTAAGRADNRRVDVDGRFVTHLPRGGTMWVTEDPVALDPRLSVSGPSFVETHSSGLVGPISFRVYTNYRAFIDRIDVVVYHAEDTDLIDPVARIAVTGGRLGEAVWNGENASARRIDAGDELVYLAYAYGGSTRDRTVPRRIGVVRPDAFEGRGARALAGHTASEEELIEDLYGRNDLTAQRNIVVRGSKVRVHGSDLDKRYGLTVNGEQVPIDREGRFAAELIVPLGHTEIDVAVTDEHGDPWDAGTVSVDATGEYFFMTGLADITVSSADLSGSVEPLSGDDRFEESILSEGRFAFYLKGKIRGKYLLTAQLDTGEESFDDILDELDRENPRSLFRRLDPDRYYPVYGDDSTTIADTDSQGKFYVRMDWDKSQALWGNFHTGLTGTEFAQYNRTLYGGKFHHRSNATTEFGAPQTELALFGSQPQSVLGHSEFLGTGGSLYYLRDADIVRGSEKVRIEIRDRDSDRVVENLTLRRGADYEVDEIQGRIILARPLAQIAREAAPSLIKDTPLDGNRPVLIVDYEYVPASFDADEATFGGRGKLWAGDVLGVGGTYVEESRNGEDYTLRGADVTLRAGEGTFLKLEYAETDASQADRYFSDNGGLSFTQLTGAAMAARSGEAYAAESRVNFQEVFGPDVRWIGAAWFRHTDAGFSVARNDFGSELENYGAELRGEASERLSFAARASFTDRNGRSEQERTGVQADYRAGQRTKLSAEVRRVRERPSPGDPFVSGLLAAARVGYEFFSWLNVFAGGQVTVDDDHGAYANNDLATVGGEVRLGEKTYAAAETSVGDRGDASLFSLTHELRPGHEIYGSYTLSTDRTAGERSVDAVRPGWTFGQRARVNNQMNVYTESQFQKGVDYAGLVHLFGLDFAPTRGWRVGSTFQQGELDAVDGSGVIDRTAGSVSAAFISDLVRFSTAFEYRRDEGAADRDQWVTTNRGDVKVNEDARVLVKFAMSDTNDARDPLDEARFVEAVIGIAYRPVTNDRFNGLAKYTYLYDLPSSGQTGAVGDQKTHLVSVEGIYRVARKWDVGAKYVHRRGELRAARRSGVWFDSTADFGAARLTYHAIKRWDGLLEYRVLDVKENDSLRTGALVGIERHIGDHLKAGIGYNFTDFSDDLTQVNDYDYEGVYFNLIGKY